MKGSSVLTRFFSSKTGATGSCFVWTFSALFLSLKGVVVGSFLIVLDSKFLRREGSVISWTTALDALQCSFFKNKGISLKNKKEITTWIIFFPLKNIHLVYLNYRNVIRTCLTKIILNFSNEILNLRWGWRGLFLYLSP